MSLFEEDDEVPDKWVYDGACGDDENPDDFFSVDPVNETRALSICKICRVRLQCAEYAITNEIVDGVWGGLTEADRKQIRATKSRSRKGIPNRKH